MEMDSFEQDYLDTYFDKSELKKIVLRVRESLRKFGITTQIWALSPKSISFHIVPKQGQEDISNALWSVYESSDDFSNVTQAIEPNTRLRVMHIFLKHNWFVPDEVKNGG